ncbi:MAG: hypothetical protein LM555_02700, partial [Desulfurococcaceae archaeon]|nr:hypothetical protein [Desulfurococcaceae archaeon]
MYKHLAHLLVALLVFSALTVLAGLSSVTYTTYADTSSDCTITLKPGDSISHYIQSTPSNSTVCLLPGEYRVEALDIANKTLTIQGLGSKPGDVKIVLTRGSLKLAPRGNETI